MRDRLTDGVDALLVPPGDAEALAAALIRVRDDTELRQRLSTEARRVAAERWGWDVELHKILDRLGLPAGKPDTD